RAEGGVPADAAVHAARQGQHERLAGRPLRRRAVRQDAALQVPQGAADLRAVTVREPRRPRPDDLGAAIALEPAWLEGDPRQYPGDPGREIESLCRAAVS